MSRARRSAGVPALLGAGCFALAFVQRPGWATADTKINLHVAPGHFLAEVASMWTSSGQLGDVQAGQQAGYLFPMGPFFALGHALGISDWVVQRLWLGTVLTLAAWGVAWLLRALLGRRCAPAELVAGAVFVLNPFVVTYANRTTVTFLAYAALPWLMLAVHRGIRDPRGWRWPAVIALLVTASGGGINGAVTAWMLLGPALLVAYEGLAGAGAAAGSALHWREVRAFLVRTLPLTALVSLWWVIPAYVQSSWGIDFLHFTEQPGTVWGTTSSTESLRLMSFWLSYVGIGFAGKAIPYFDDSGTMLFSAPVVVATLLLPAAALGGFVWTRRWRYGPFFVGLALVAVLIMGAGFPEGTPLRHGLNFTYNHVSAVQFLRASYKAAPLLAVALACLMGVAAPELWTRLPRPRRRPAGSATGSAVPAAAAGVAALTGAAVLALAAWPLVTGHAQDAQVSYRRVPLAWRQAARDVNRDLPPNSRAIVLPGDLFSFYTWGGTVDPILPALTTRPVAERAEVPYSDLRATDLLWTIDGLVHQQRLLPGQLEPLLALIGVREVVTGSDDDLARSDAPAPADAAAELAGQPGFAAPTRSYGPVTAFSPTGIGAPVRLPEVRTYDLPAARGLVRVQPRAAPVIVDGSAGGIAGLAAFGALTPGRTLLYAADLPAGQLRSASARGADVVISDSNRRQAFVSGSLEQNAGPVLTPAQDVSADGFVLDPFGSDPDDETVAVYSGGISSVSAPYSPQITQFPEHQPFAALDGSPATAWLADPTLGAGDRWLQVTFPRPRVVSSVGLMPYGDAGGMVRQVTIAGRVFAVHPGWNRLVLGLRGVTTLRVALTSVSPPVRGAVAGAGGIRELRIPGVQATEALRLPVDAARALAGLDLSATGLSYLFERQTGDEPFARNPALSAPWSARDVHEPGDAEQTMRRLFLLPAARSFTASAWVTPFAQTPDDVLDRLAGYRGAVRVTSSGRFDGEPRYRASTALDTGPADHGSAWIADWNGPDSAWWQVVAPRPFHVGALRLVTPGVAVRRPTEVRLLWPGGGSARLTVSSSGTVAVAPAIVTRVLRIVVLSAAVPPGATSGDRSAVGIGAVRGLRGLAAVAMPSSSTFSAPCGSVSVRIGGAGVALRVTGSALAFADGRPLAASSSGCGAPVALRAGEQLLAVANGPFAVDELRLSSPAPSPPAVAAADSSQVLDPGVAGEGSYDGVRVRIAAPSWLVLGESYDRGWEAFCDGHSLGAPTPVDGYANGWPVGPGCRDVRFVFAPNRLAEAGYIASGAGGVLCVLLIGLALWRRRRRRAASSGAASSGAASSVVAPGSPSPGSPPPGSPPAGAEPRLAPGRAAAAALPAAFVFGFIFGIVPGVLALPAIAVVLWRGIGARALTLAATALLALVVPILYLVHTGGRAGGNHYGYPMAHLGAHYAGVAALGLLAAALWRSLPLRAGTRPPPANGGAI